MRSLGLCLVLTACEPVPTIIQLEDTNPPYEPGIDTGPIQSEDQDSAVIEDSGLMGDTAIEEDCIPEAEICDGIDNDCDGLIDDADADLDLSTAHEFYLDEDGDAFGLISENVWACEAPEHYTDTAGDCSDHDPDVWPGAEEICDGIDNDCDNYIDSEDACPFPFGQNSDHSYFFVEDMSSWFEADGFCQSYGYGLVDVLSENEFYFIGDLLPFATSIWIGFNDIEQEGYWAWNSGESPFFVNWAPFEPSLANDCAYIDPVGNWRTSDCSYLSSFVCEARP